MHRFVGKKKATAPPPTLDDASKRLEGRGDTIEGKVAKLDKELLLVKKKLQGAKGPAAAALKKKALDILKRKKMYEKQLGQVQSTQFNIDQQAFMVESMRDTHDTVTAMKASAKVVKQQMKKIDVDKIEELYDDIAETYEDHEEVMEVMSRALGTELDVDEDDLDAELAALDDLDLNEMEGEDEADYLKTSNLPSAPTSAVQGAADKDEYGLPAVPVAQP